MLGKSIFAFDLIKAAMMKLLSNFNDQTSLTTTLMTIRSLLVEKYLDFQVQCVGCIISGLLNLSVIIDLAKKTLLEH